MNYEIEAALEDEKYIPLVEELYNWCSDYEDMSVQLEYSGRAMYGETCVAVYSQDPGWLVDFILYLWDNSDWTDITSDIVKVLRISRMDSMGSGVVTEFRQLKTKARLIEN